MNTIEDHCQSERIIKCPKFNGEAKMTTLLPEINTIR